MLCRGCLAGREQAVATQGDNLLQSFQGLRADVESAVEGDLHTLGGINETAAKRHVDVAIGEREGIRRKPAPDTVYTAMEHMQVLPDESVYIGDSEIDLQTAENAGLDVIAVTWGFRTEEFLRARGADVLVDDPMEILP